MTERRRRLWMALGTAGLASGLLLAFVFLGAKEAPRVPRDRDHALTRTEEDCLRCHGPDGANARPKNHPLRDDCFSCHMWAHDPPAPVGAAAPGFGRP